MSRPNYSYFYLTYEKWASCIAGPDCPSSYFYSDHLIRCSDSNIPINGSAAGAVVGYDQVTVMEGENGENGKTAYTYLNNPDDVPPYNDPHNNLPLRPPYGYTIPDLLNGSLKQQIDSANNNGILQKVKEITNTYESSMDNENTIYGMETRTYQKFNSIANPFSRGQAPTLPCDRLLLCYWHQKSQWNYLSSTCEKVYTLVD